MAEHLRRLKITLLLSFIAFFIFEIPVHAAESSFPGAKDDFYFAAESENNIYAIASDGNVWNWNGAWWWQVTSGRVIERRIVTFDSNLIYGLSREEGNDLQVFKWNGTNWSVVTPNGSIKEDFYFVSETEIYCIGLDDQVYLWNGAEWRRVTYGEIAVKNHIQADSEDLIYGISLQGELVKWNGLEWKTFQETADIENFFLLRTEDEVFAIRASRRVNLWNGQSWRNITAEFPLNGRIVVNSLTEIYSLGTDGMIWQWNGEKWLSVTTSTTDSSNITGSTFYRAKHLGGMVESPPAIIAFKERLIIACKGIGGNIYVREWQPLRHDSWDSARNALITGNNTWYPLDGTTIETPELAINNGTLFIYAKSSADGVYKKQFLGPGHWSISWEEDLNHTFRPGPFTSAGFTIIPSNSGGYPSSVSLVKLKDFILQSKPDWIKDLIIYEIPTKVFTSPNGPGTGTFKSTMEKLDHLKDLGVTAIWLNGHSWSDPRHYASIYTQYANIHPALLDPSFGSDPSNIEKTEREFGELVQAVHERGIKVILDVVTHGVMSYSPLVSANSTFPSYVNSHPLQSTITPHPDWFGVVPYVAFDDPVPAQTEIFHDPKCFPYDTKMINYVGGYEQTDLDDWWVDVWTKYILDFDIDGLKLDLGSSRFDLWMRIKENASNAGHELIILPEGDMDDYPFDASIFDIELVSYDQWILFAPEFQNRNEPAFGIIIQDMKRAEEEIFPLLLNRQYFIIPISIHDSPSYNLRGSRFKMGYGSMFTPFIPLFLAGEEFNNPLPDSTIPPYGWLLGSAVQWNQLGKIPNALFYLDMKKAISIRKNEPSLTYFSPQGNPNVVVIENFASSLQQNPTPYIRFVPNSNEAILIVGNNNTNMMAQFSINVPLSQVGLDGYEFYRVNDLWHNREAIVSRQDMNSLTVLVTPDNFRILKISPASSTEAQLTFPWQYVAYATGATILMTATIALLLRRRKGFNNSHNGTSGV